MSTPEDRLREYVDNLIEVGDDESSEYRSQARTSLIAVERTLKLLEIKIPGINTKWEAKK